MTEPPLFLLANDDGVHARGLRSLREALAELGRVITVAPTEQQSAGSHSLTLHRPLRHRVVGPDVHAIDGSPADCVYVALYREGLLPRWPDLVVSGINHGFNLGNDIYYSGTVAAAREAALRGVPAVAFSLGPAGDFGRAAEAATRIVARTVSSPGIVEGDHGALLNVNFPGGESEYRGLRVTRLGRRIYHDVVDVREDPRGKEYFWIGGPKDRHEPIEGSDTEAIDGGYVSITPLGLDVTAVDDLGLAAWVASVGIRDRDAGGASEDEEGR